MTGRTQRAKPSDARPRTNPQRRRDTRVKAGSRAYVRARDLPKLIALWPHELEDRSEAGRLHIIVKLRRALRAERRAAPLPVNWSYGLNRHLALLSAYEGERAAQARAAGALSRTAPGAAGREEAAE